MTSAQIRRFSQVSSDSRASSYGETCEFQGTTITVVCQPLNDLELLAGGFEQAGIMKALVQGDIIPAIHDRLGIRGKTWVVKRKLESLASVETALFLEAVAGVRDL